MASRTSNAPSFSASVHSRRSKLRAHRTTQSQDRSDFVCRSAASTIRPHPGRRDDHLNRPIWQLTALRNAFCPFRDEPCSRRMTFNRSVSELSHRRSETEPPQGPSMASLTKPCSRDSLSRVCVNRLMYPPFIFIFSSCPTPLRPILSKRQLPSFESFRQSGRDITDSVLRTVSKNSTSLKFVAVLPSIAVNSLCNLGESLCLETGRGTVPSPPVKILRYDPYFVCFGARFPGPRLWLHTEVVPLWNTSGGEGLPVRPNWMRSRPF